MGGGKFANGAVTAAFSEAFNEVVHSDEVRDWFDPQPSAEAPNPNWRSVLFRYDPNLSGLYNFDVQVRDAYGNWSGQYFGTTSFDVLHLSLCASGGCNTVADGSYAFFADLGTYAHAPKDRYLMLRLSGVTSTSGIAMSGVWVHSGYNTGTYAKGCLTVSPSDYESFISNFSKETISSVTVRSNQ